MSETLTETELAEIEALSAKVPDGPWFADADVADDVPDHRRSGLALVDTGRSGDWWIARLCEWHTAQFIADSKTNIDALCRSLRAAWAENQALEQMNVRLTTGLVNIYHVITGEQCKHGVALGMATSAVSSLLNVRDQLAQVEKSAASAMRDKCVDALKSYAMENGVSRFGHYSIIVDGAIEALESLTLDQEKQQS